jgi:hypothetical protein
MIQLRTFLFTVLVTGLSYGLSSAAGHQATETAGETTPFPILTRFELPRDYGYFIGDEIPLTLVVETSEGVVLDLVNLPKQGEKHGLFEIRELRLTTIPHALGGTVYRAAYVLQYFGVTPLTVHFEPLEILYAQAGDRHGPGHTYSYKSLLTQPIALNLARIGPYGPTRALDITGPVRDSRVALVWGSFCVGALCLLLVMGRSGRQWYVSRKCRQASRQTNLSPVAATLEALRQEGVALRPMPDAPFPGVERLQSLLRQYIQAVYAVSASTLTTTELGRLLSDQPFVKDILNVLARCDLVKYDVPSASPSEARQLWWEALTVFEKLQQTDAT